MRIHVLASYDGMNYDTEDLATFEIPFVKGKTVRKTFGLEAEVMFIKVLIENLDKAGLSRNTDAR